MRKNGISLLLIVSLLALSSCSKKESSSSASSPVPSMVTIAKATLPSSLESSAVGFNLTEEFVPETNLDEMKDRLFSPGPTDFMYRLNSVDSRLDSLADAIIACADTPTSTYNPPTTLATGFSFPMELACVQTVDATSMGVSDFKVYFGKSGGYWYIAEIQTNASFESNDSEPPTMAVLSKIDENGEEMEVFQISVEKSSADNLYYASVTHILANKTLGIFEISSASSADSTHTNSPGANFTGLGCGIQMKTNGTYVYGSGIFSQMNVCPASASPCGNATDLSDATGSCGSLTSFTTLAMDRSTISGNSAKQLVVDRTWLSGLSLQ
jgi:hypothetical protein